MKPKTKLINSWILALFFLIPMVLIWKCAHDEYEAVTAAMVGIGSEQLTQKAEIADLYREVQIERQRLSELKHSVMALQLAMNMDGYRIELVPLLVPGDVKKEDLPEVLK